MSDPKTPEPTDGPTPGSSAVPDPTAITPDATIPDPTATTPDATIPDATEGDATKVEASEADTSPEAAQPETTAEKPNAEQPDAQSADPVKADAAKTKPAEPAEITENVAEPAPDAPPADVPASGVPAGDIPVPAGGVPTDDTTSETEPVKASQTAEAPAVPMDGEKPDGQKAKSRRSPWMTVGTIVAVLLVLAGFGYFAGLGPMSRLSTTRALHPPETLGGLSRITDAEIRKSLELDTTRETLSRVNDSKKVAVEAYGDPAGDKMYVVIALRGKVDLDKTIKADGATPDQVKKVGDATCVPTADNLVTRCYRSSNTLTVIAQDATNKLDVETVGPIANEAFDAMR